MKFIFPVGRTFSGTSQSGQAGLVILLLTVAVLTIGISVASRTSTDVKLSRQEEESNRAFNAAESQIEELLSQDLSTLPATGSENLETDNLSLNYSIDQIRILETRIPEGKEAQVDVTGSNGNGIQIQWSKERNCDEDMASLLVMTFSRDAVSGQVSARSTGYSLCDRADGLTTVTALPAGNPFAAQVTHPLQANDLFVLIHSVYNDTQVRVEGQGWTLPVQYYKVRSVAQNSLGGESRAVEVNRTKPAIPSVFSYVLTSGTSITK